MKKLTKIAFLFSVALVSSCGKTEGTATDQNQVLLNNAPESKAYKDELSLLLKEAKPSAIEYRFNHYEYKDSTDYLYIDIDGAVKAIAVVTVREWDEPIEKIKAFKGKGYSGAELKNLQLEVERDSATTSFIYKGVDEVVD